MQSLNFILNIASDLIPGGAALKMGVQAIVNAATIADYTYDADNDPQGAFDFMLSPCGSTNLVPEDIKMGFDIAIGAAGGRIRGIDVAKPKPKWKKGSGKKGDDGNPKKREKPTKTTSSQPQKTEECKLGKRAGGVQRKGNAFTSEECNKGKTTTTIYTVTSLEYGPTTTVVTATCKDEWSQACHHYSSAIKVNAAWKTLTCPQPAATKARDRDGEGELPAKETWYSQHKPSWRKMKYRKLQKTCGADEFPPFYMLDRNNDVAALQSGIDATGQLIRYISQSQNSGAASMWTSMCFDSFYVDSKPRKTKAFMTPQEIYNAANKAKTSFGKKKITGTQPGMPA